MSNESKTPFTDNFFRVTRKVMYFILGNDHKDVFKYCTEVELTADDFYCLRDATGIKTKPHCWFIGTFNEPIVVCGQCYPTGTLAVFQSREPGSHFALFSLEDGD